MGKIPLRLYQELIIEEFLKNKNVYLDAFTGIGISHIIIGYLELKQDKKILIVYPSKFMVKSYLEYMITCDLHLHISFNELFKDNLYKHFKEYELITVGYHPPKVKYLDFLKTYKRIHIHPNKHDLDIKTINDKHLRLNTPSSIKILERKHKIKKLLKL